MASVLRDGWRIFCQDFVLFAAIWIVSDAISTEWFFRYRFTGRVVGVPGPLVGLALLWSVVVFAFSNALVVPIVFQKFRGQPVTVGASLRRVLSRAGPIFLTSIAVAAIVIAGIAVLIIPGLMAWTTFAVTIPVCVVEEKGPGASLSRSCDLTRFHRWPIFGVFIAYIVSELVLGKIVRLAWITLLHRPETSFGLTIASGLIGEITEAFLAVVIVLIYCHLRAAQENLVTGKRVLNLAPVPIVVPPVPTAGRKKRKVQRP